MRRLVLLAGIVVVAACGSSSGSPSGPDEGPGSIEIAAELERTDAGIAASEVGAVLLAFELEEGQRQAIAEALARARAALADLTARWLAGEIDAAATVAEARTIRAALDAELAAILTPEQLAELQARRAAFRPGLELTDEQREAIRAILDDWYVLVLETFEAVREGELSFADAGRALAEGARAARAAVCGVLEPDQLDAFPHCAAPAAG